LKLPVFELALVESFNADLSPDSIKKYNKGKPEGDGSGDMKGRVRLADGTVLPFDYFDWAEPFLIDYPGETSSYGDFDLRGGRDFPGRRMFSWPFAERGIMVYVQDGAVQFWTWPHIVLMVDGSSYCELYAVVDTSRINREWIKELRAGMHRTFGPGAVYFGDDVAGFLHGPDAPAKYLVLKWDPAVQKVVCD
jgi:hypothetical protein